VGSPRPLFWEGFSHGTRSGSDRAPRRFCHSTGSAGPVAKNDHFRRSGSPVWRPGGLFWQKRGVFGLGGLIPREMVSIPDGMVGPLRQMVGTPDEMVWLLHPMVWIPVEMVGLLRPMVLIPGGMVGPLRQMVCTPDRMVALLCTMVFLPARPGWPLAPGIWPPRCRGTCDWPPLPAGRGLR
jgi:hypothetical protein